jgi:predicted esterase
MTRCLRLPTLFAVAVIAVVAVVVMASPAAAQRKKSKSGMGQGEFVKVDFTEPDWQGAYYTVFIPKGVTPRRTYPLVVALHGNGAKSDGHCRNLAKVSTAEAPAFVVAPQYQKGNKFNNPLYTPTGKFLKTMLDAVIAKYPIDESRLVLQGFSMGGNTLASWTYAWMGEDAAGYPFDLIWFSSTAIPPRSGRNGKGGEVAPKIPMVLMTGSKETNVMGLVNVVKQTRQAYRVFHQRGHDVRYIQIPNMGHSVNGVCLDHMRQSLAELTSFAGAIKRTKKLPASADPALALAGQGKCAEALAELEVLRATDSPLTGTEKGKVASQVKSIEKFLKGHAASQSKKLMSAFTPTSYDKFLTLAESLNAHKTLGKTYGKAVEKLSKHRVVKAQLKAREAFVAAGKLEDPAASLAAMQVLATGKLQSTLFGQRAASHIQAMSDDWEDGNK